MAIPDDYVRAHHVAVQELVQQFDISWSTLRFYVEHPIAAIGFVSVDEEEEGEEEEEEKEEGEIAADTEEALPLIPAPPQPQANSSITIVPATAVIPASPSTATVSTNEQNRRLRQSEIDQIRNQERQKVVEEYGNKYGCYRCKKLGHLARDCTAENHLVVNPKYPRAKHDNRNSRYSHSKGSSRPPSKPRGRSRSRSRSSSRRSSRNSNERRPISPFYPNTMNLPVPSNTPAVPAQPVNAFDQFIQTLDLEKPR